MNVSKKDIALHNKHNREMRKFIELLGDFYLDAGMLDDRLDDLLFYHLAYGRLIRGSVKSALSETGDFAAHMGEGMYFLEVFVKEGAPERLEEADFSGRTYRLISEMLEFKEKKEKQKEYRAKLRKEKKAKGLDKKSLIKARRKEVLRLYDKKTRQTDIAIKLGVSLSTVEKDLHYLRMTGRLVCVAVKRQIKRFVAKMLKEVSFMERFVTKYKKIKGGSMVVARVRKPANKECVPAPKPDGSAGFLATEKELNDYYEKKIP